MNRNNTVKIIGLILIAAVGWAVIANRLISSLSQKFDPQYLNLIRILNNSLVVTLVGTTMYILITKLRKRLKAADENYGRLFENIPAPMFIYDASTYKFLAANKAAELQYGYTKEELLTLGPANLRVRGRLQSLYDVNEQFATKDFQPAYWLHEDKFGKAFYVCVYTCDTIFDGKQAKQAMIINIDEKVKAESVLREKKYESGSATTESEIKNPSIPQLA